MKFKNISSRPHWVGDTLIAPGATEEVADQWATAVQTDELQAVELEAPKGKPGRKPKEVAEQTNPEEAE